MLLSISEGDMVTTGLVKVQGNFITKDKVIRRLVRIEPGRPLDGREIGLAQLRLQADTVVRKRPGHGAGPGAGRGKHSRTCWSRSRRGTPARSTSGSV